MAQRQLEDHLAESEKNLEGMKEKLPEIEKSVAELNRSMEKLFNSVEDQRQLSLENQQALANLVHGGFRVGPSTEKDSVPGQKRKLPKDESATSSQKEHRGEEQFHERHKFKKVEMSAFDGDQSDDWLFRAERYFDIHQLTDQGKITVTAISFPKPR